MIKDFDFNYDSYTVNCSEEGYHDCESSGCEEEGICRCYTITSVNVDDVNIPNIRRQITSEIHNVRGKDLSFVLGDQDTEINFYCIERILRANKLWEQDAWDIEWGSDYYGDSIFSIKVESSLAYKIDAQIYEMMLMSSIIDKIKYVLNLEYGYILPEINRNNAEIITVSSDEIVLSSSNRAKTLDVEIRDKSYTMYDLPVGVCYKKNGKYVAVDGHNRISANNKKQVKIIHIP